MNELEEAKSQHNIPEKLDAARHALAEATEDWQRIEIKDHARAVAAAIAILERKDIQVQAANLVQDAERAIVKANPPMSRSEIGKLGAAAANQNMHGTHTPEKNTHTTQNSIVSKNVLAKIRQAHSHITDEEFEAKKAEALQSGIPLTQSALIQAGKRKLQAEKLKKREESVKERNEKFIVREPTKTSHKVYFGDNLSILSEIPDENINLVYTDPPFNTGKLQKDHKISYPDDFGKTEEYLDFLRPRFEEVHRVLHPTGSLFFHIDQRESHYCKVMLDEIFGRKSFINEIIWAYDFGGRSNKKMGTEA